MFDLLPALQELVDSGQLPEWPDGFPTVTYDDSDPSDPQLIIEDERDLSIPIGTWTLRLVPYEQDTGGTRLVIHLEPGTDGSLTGLHVELARFELTADTDHLVAADLHTEPYTHLTPTANRDGEPTPVMLLGPGVTLRMSGDGLEEVSVEVTGAQGGSDDAFPSVRFEPPHFLVGDGFIGVVCDEVLLDLSTDANPGVVDTAVTDDPTWRGLHLKNLGVFLNSEGGTDTWSGMASMQDFFIGFDAVDLTGTFAAELVHHVVPSPQVMVEIWVRDANGKAVRVTNAGDAALDAPTTGGDGNQTALDAPTDGLDYRLVRLVARPSWDDPEGIRAAGVRVSWTVPAGVTVEEPLHLTKLDLGWVQVPPGTFTFSAEVSDHRIADITEQRVVTVAAPTAPGTTGLAAILDAGLIDPDVPATELPTHRLHVPIPVASPGRQLRVVARVRGGSGTADAQLTVPAGFTISAGSPTITITRPTGANAYDVAVWRVTAPSSLPSERDGAFALTVTDTAGTTVERRLRFTLAEAPDDGAPDFRLTPYTDWRAAAGPGIARIELFGGLAFRDILWELEHERVTDALFADAAGDALFATDAVLPVGQSPALSLSAGTIRPHLHTAGQLWRLTGTVRSDAGVATPPPVVIGEPPDSSRLAGDEVTLLTGNEVVDVHDTRGVLFAYDSAGVQVASSQPGPEPPALQRSHADIMTLQAEGLKVLLEALHHFGDRIEEVGVYGAASAEGPLAYNHHLGRQRADAVAAVLAAFVAGGVSSTLLTKLDAVGYVPPADLQARIAHLAGAITTGSVGETGADSTPGVIDPDDRRVFCVLRLTAVQPPTVTHRTYFVTLPGAPPPAVAPVVPRQELAEHPFRHAIFRQARVEVELLRNRLVRLQIRLTLDLERFKENDLLDTTELNPHDGVTTIFFEYVEDPSDEGSRYEWRLAAVADPRDVDGFAVITDETTANLVGGPAIVVPALTALAGGRIGLSAFLAASAVGALLTTPVTGARPVDVDRIVFSGFNGRIAYGRGDATELRVGIDYTVHYDLDIDLGDMGLPVTLKTSEPITVTFRNLGVSLRDWQHVEFDYDPMDGFALEIDDPGVFQLGEGIGRLLTVNSFRSGAGSPLWIELELAIGLDTGIFRIDALRLRLSVDAAKLFDRDATGALRLGAGDLEFADFDLSISKLGVSATVPGVLAGSGQASIGKAVLQPSGIEGTQVSGDVDLALLPLSLRLYAGMKLFHSPELTAVYAYLGAEFSPGIPLGNTGVGLYGMEGLVGVNMARSEPDAREVLAWYTADPRGVTHTDKWEPEPGAWAFGVGAVLGTSVDTGFTWSTKGGLVVQGPGPQILLATYSRFVSPKPGLLPVAAEAGLATVILLDFDNGLLLAALEFQLVAEPLLSLKVPAEIFFNLRSAKDWHLRLGTWTPEHKRIQARIFGMFDAWAYVQVEGNGFQGPGISLAGLSVAHGAGTSIVIGSKAARVYAEASLAYHLGVQLRPFYAEGNLRAEGELILGPISLGVSLSIEAKAPVPFVLRGEACAKVKILFVTLEGCVGFSIGSGDATTPAPDHPLRELVAVDRMTSTAVTPDPDDPDTAPRVPLDAALHLSFDQVVRDRRTEGAALDLGSSTVWRNQVSTDLYYEYDITELRLAPVGGGAPHAPMQSAWAQPSLEDASPDEADGPRALRLLDWKPNAHTRALDFEAGYGRTVDGLVQRLCEPVPAPVRGCASFDGQPFGPGTSWRLDDGTLSPVTVTAGFGEIVGGALLRGSVAATVVAHPPVHHDLRIAKRKVLRLPAAPPSRMRPSLEQLFVPPEKLPDAGIPVKGDDGWVGSGPVPDQRTMTPEPPGLLDHVQQQDVQQRDIQQQDVQQRDEQWEERRRHEEQRERDRLLDGRPWQDALAELSPWAARLAGAETSDVVAAVLAPLLLIRLPDLVEAEVVLLVRRDASGGAALFLTEAMTPIGASRSFDDADTVAGSVGHDAFVRHRAISVSLSCPPSRRPQRAAWLAILAPSGWHGPGPDDPKGPSGLDVHAYLAQVCGTTFGAWDRARQAEEARDGAHQTITDLAGPVAGTSASSSAPLLAPDTAYRLTGTLAWRRYRSADGAAVDGTGTLSIDHGFTTAADAPTDIRRYVHHLDPATPDQPHYGAEPVTIVFGEDVIDRLFAEFGLQLVARLKPDVGGRALNQPLRAGASREFLPLDSYARAFAAAVDASACLTRDLEGVSTGLRLFPSLTYRTSLPLERNTGYTMSLLPRPLSDPPTSTPAGAPDHLGVEGYWDQQLQLAFDAGEAVLRAELRSSRWLSFGEHLEAFRAGEVLDVIGGDTAALDAVVAELGGDARGDAAIDALNLALFGGPLPVPDRCQLVRLWTIAGAAPGPFAPPPFAFAGLLLDGPEPVLRRRPDGTPSVEVAVTTDAGAPVTTTVIAGTAGARVALLCQPPPGTTELRVRLTYDRDPDPASAPVVEELLVAIPSMPGDEGQEAP